jgi:cell wall-associated NlpC family hydrolase
MAVAEMLKVEMMRQSLALSGEPEERRAGVGTVLNALLAGYAENDPSAGNIAVEETGQTSPPPPPNYVEEGGIEKTAFGFLGTPYLFGGEGPSGIDCSSFVQQVFGKHDIALPRTAREQIKVGRDVPPEDLRKGDLVFFSTYASYPSHVGIYLGDGKMIHASSHKGQVVVSELNSDYYRSRFLGARRLA